MTNSTNLSASNVSLALVTGGSRGLGKSMALHLADRGVDVILTYRSRADEAAKVVESIRSKGRKAAALALDAGDTKTFGAFAEAVRTNSTT
jgi:NAD(P)-dependent dehydrogenase (short-subunit alcohol dehydrogenase family)